MVDITATSPIRALAMPGPVSVGEKLTIRSVAALLADLDIGAVVVARDSGGWGLISERDIVRMLVDEGDPDVVWGPDIMSTEPVTIGSEARVLDAALTMIDENVRHLLVVDDAGEVVGIVSMRDVLRVLNEVVLDTLSG